MTMRWTVAQLRRTLPLLIAKGETLNVARKLGGRIYSEKTWYLLRRDPGTPFIAPPPRIPIRVRPVEKSDYPSIIAEHPARLPALEAGDRKSTRLNSSHPSISYAVFCLKKKNITKTHI